MWWVVAGVAVLVSAALVVWLLVSSSSSTPALPPASAPVSAATPSSEASAASSSLEPEPTEAFDYGDFPPTYELKDLSNPIFPEELDGFELHTLDEGLGSVMASYWAQEGIGVFSPSLASGRQHYRIRAGDWTDAEFFGRALCGQPPDFPDQVACVMAGESQTLIGAAALKTFSMAELAAMTEALYDAL